MESYFDLAEKYFVTFSHHFSIWADAVMEDPISGSAVVILGLIVLYLGIRLLGFVAKLIWLAVVGLFIIMPQYILATLKDGAASVAIGRRSDSQMRAEGVSQAASKFQEFL